MNHLHWNNHFSCHMVCTIFLIQLLRNVFTWKFINLFRNNVLLSIIILLLLLCRLSVSRAIKPYADSSRPPEWFHQKNCVLQYYDMMEQLEHQQPKYVKSFIFFKTTCTFVVTPWLDHMFEQTSWTWWRWQFLCFYFLVCIYLFLNPLSADYNIAHLLSLIFWLSCPLHKSTFLFLKKKKIIFA